MRIGIRGHDLNGTGIDALIQGLKQNGLDTLQLVCHKSFEDVPYAPDGLTAARAAELGHILSENKIKVALLGAYFNPVHSDREKVNAGIGVFQNYLRLARLFDCRMVGS